MKAVYVIGDSISMHYGPYLKQYLSGIVHYSRKEAGEAVALGLDPPQDANGGDSSMVLAFLRAKEKAGGIRADIVLVNCGLHDIKTDPQTGKKQVSLDDYRHNLTEILAALCRMGVQTAWVRTTPCDERVHNRPGIPFHRFSADVIRYNEAADAVMAAAGIPVIDLYTFTANLGDSLFCDHVHFRQEVRERQAAFIAGWIAAWAGTKGAT